jgi:hypothetical protein
LYPTLGNSPAFAESDSESCETTEKLGDEDDLPPKNWSRRSNRIEDQKGGGKRWQGGDIKGSRL